MDVSKEKVTKLKISGAKSLDPVTVIVDDLGPEQGKIIIECYGKAWSAYWGAMGAGGLAEFFCGCDNDYIIRKMLTDTHQTDFNKITDTAGDRGFDICVNSDVELAMMSSEMSECFGGDWYMDLPRCHTSDYVYLSRIIDAVKEALKTGE